MTEKVMGIMGAMPEEIDAVVQLLSVHTQSLHAGRVYYEGYLNTVKAVVVVSGWGKVAAAATVSTLIHKFNITELIFTGVAGAIDPHLRIGDIVIGSRLVQHDMDARPFIPQYEIPLLKKTFFDCAPVQLAVAADAVKDLFNNNSLHSLIGTEALQQFNMAAPSMYMGDIASGDQFFSDDIKKQQLLQNLPGVLCVEMEGAAVAQVCYENELPFTVIRTISDAAGEGSPVDFAAFIERVAGKYSVAIIRNIVK
jgi:adenosylhomocysteine nucleosidase